MNAEKYITFALDKEIYKELKLYCLEYDIKIKDFISNAIKEKLEKK